VFCMWAFIELLEEKRMRAEKRDFRWALLLCLWMCSPGKTSNSLSYPPWEALAPLSEVNSSFHDKSPFLSFDGRTLYFSREYEAGGYFARMFQATRPSLSCPFGVVTEIASLTDSRGHVTCPWVSADNLRMYYYSTSGMTRWLRMSQRGTADAPWPPGAYVSELNALGSVANPTLTEDELTIVFSGYWLSGGRGEWDLWMATRPNRYSRFGNVKNLWMLNTVSSDMHPSITPDGLTLYFASNRNDRFQIFRACRDSRDSQFGRVEHVATLDTAEGYSAYPSISADGTTLYFGSQRDGSSMDIWFARFGPAYFVDAVHGNDSYDGMRPVTAFATIQRAINVAMPGDVIGVYPGVYREGIRFLGKAITVQSIGDAAVIEARNGFAVSFYGEGPATVLRNFVIANSHIGLFYSYGAPTITNVTVVGNVYGAQAFGTGAGPRISNGIFWDNILDDLSGCQATYSCVQRFNPGKGNFSEDPLFVDAGNGDYHLRSARGRYWPEHDVWVLDEVTSPCIDAGDPAADFSKEPEPNGGRLNVGAYGGTAYASRSAP